MKLGIIGLSFSGKTILFEALTGNIGKPDKKTEARIATIMVPDEPVD